MWVLLRGGEERLVFEGGSSWAQRSGVYFGVNPVLTSKVVRVIPPVSHFEIKVLTRVE